MPIRFRPPTTGCASSGAENNVGTIMRLYTSDYRKHSLYAVRSGVLNIYVVLRAWMKDGRDTELLACGTRRYINW